MTMKKCDAGERGGEKQKIDQHGEIVSPEMRGDAYVHVQVPAGFVVDSAGEQTIAGDHSRGSLIWDGEGSG
jgi:hypothetical protein